MRQDAKAAKKGNKPMSVVKQLESRFLDRFRSEQVRLEDKYPELKFEVWSNSTGSKTQLKGPDIGIECLFPLASQYQLHIGFVRLGG